MKRASVKQPQDKIKITLSISRGAIATLDRIRAKRFEEGASRRQLQNSALVEEAIKLLKREEGMK